jgi:hypothetical protein
MSEVQQEEKVMPPLRATNVLETIEGARLHSSECGRWQR